MLKQSSCIYSSKSEACLDHDGVVWDVPKKMSKCHTRREINIIIIVVSIPSFPSIVVIHSLCFYLEMVLITCCSFQLISLTTFADIGHLRSGWHCCHALLASLLGRARSHEIFFINVLVSKWDFKVGSSGVVVPSAENETRLVTRLSWYEVLREVICGTTPPHNMIRIWVERHRCWYVCRWNDTYDNTRKNLGRKTERVIHPTIVTAGEVDWRISCSTCRWEAPGVANDKK